MEFPRLLPGMGSGVQMVAEMGTGLADLGVLESTTGFCA